jgi:hypothetical protein
MSVRSKKAAIVAATLVLAGCGASAGIASADPPAPPPVLATTMDHDGTYSLGSDIAPGTYSSAGPVGSGTCYWKRMSGSDIVDSAMSSKPQVVQINASDTTFKTDGCQAWQLTDSASADGAAPADIPPWIAQAQLRAYLDALNAGARQYGVDQLPSP